jgi:hypothetical protein
VNNVGKMENWKYFLAACVMWGIIYAVWYWRNYPDRIRTKLGLNNIGAKWSFKRRKPTPRRPAASYPSDFRALVETVETICARDSFGSSDAATMVQAVKRLMEIEPASGQIWEAYALDSLETARISCDHCNTPVEKTIKKTGIKISCKKCGKWLALKNSKVTIIDPSRIGLEDWEK